MGKYIILFLCSAFIIFSGCRRNVEPDPKKYENGTNASINNWIYDNMDLYYYWTDELPDKKIDEQDPEDFFYSLLSQKDRFSWIQPNFQELLNSLQGVTLEAGYEFTLYNDVDRANGVVGQISYVKRDSPAKNAQLKRGDIFRQINGTPLTVSNYVSLIGATSKPHTLQVERYNPDIKDFENLGKLTLNTIQFAENPNLLDTVLIRNNKKIGYFVYNLFATGPTAKSDTYLQEMDEVFQRFKSQGIDHLVLDLRYNSGGAESATINLASLIGSNISNKDIFVKRDYNAGLKQAYIDQYGKESLDRMFLSKSQNIGSSLKSPQLTVLTSSRTASASELLINGLDPFMDIFIIGDTTVGKNVGSTSFYEDDNDDNDWGMQPIITKSFNSLNQSDYSDGFYPDIPLKDNSLIKLQLGDVNEALLKEAIIYLAGSDEASRKHTTPNMPAKDIGSSLERKRSFGIYNIELDK